jgi:fructokinase
VIEKAEARSQKPDRGGGAPRIGIDLGGTKIEIVVLGEDGSVRWRRRVATPRDDYEGTLAAVARLVAEAERHVGPGRVGIGIPGTVSRATGLIKNANSTWLIGRPLHRDLEARLERPLRLANDANCFAVSEASDGAASGAATVFGVILGTGVGGGIVVNGAIVEGANSIAGEWGHNPLPWPKDEERPGPACYCGRYGCIETFLSGPGLAADYARRGGAPGCAARDVAERAAQGDPVASGAMAVWDDRLARALASVVNVLDPEVIVAGGGLSNLGRIYETVPRLWAPYVFSDAVTTRVVPARHGDASGVRGAAWLWGPLLASGF